MQTNFNWTFLNKKVRSIVFFALNFSRVLIDLLCCKELINERRTAKRLSVSNSISLSLG